MWSTAKTEDPETAKAARTRLFTVLGLDQPDLQENASPLLSSPAPESIKSNGKASDSPVSIITERLNVPNATLSSGERQTAVLTFTESAIPKVERPVEKRSRHFEESPAGTGTNTLSPLETIGGRPAKLESPIQNGHDADSTVHESLANLSKKMTEAVHGQINILEQSLGKIAEEIGSRIHTQFEPVAKRVESYRVQADEVNSTLESALASFTQRADEAAKKQTWLFEDKISRISQQAVSQVQESIQSGITQVREAAAHSLEQRIEAMSDNAERRLKENFEAWSKAQLDGMQQQAATVTSNCLSQLRAESESVAQGLQAQLKSDAQLLETNTLEAMQGKVQKITEEFRSMLQRTLSSLNV